MRRRRPPDSPRLESHSSPVRTYVRVSGRIDPARRRRCVLRLGRAAGRSASARQADDRRRRGGHGRELRGARIRDPRRDGRTAARGGSARTPAVVPPRFSAYTEASKALFDLFEQTAPLVEGMSLEEAFLDVRGLERISGTPRQIAERLRRQARERVGLAVTVGVARTKVLAKMASRAGQAGRPAGHRAGAGGGVPAAAAGRGPLGCRRW